MRTLITEILMTGVLNLILIIRVLKKVQLSLIPVLIQRISGQRNGTEKTQIIKEPKVGESAKNGLHNILINMVITMRIITSAGTHPTIQDYGATPRILKPDGKIAIDPRIVTVGEGLLLLVKTHVEGAPQGKPSGLDQMIDMLS